MLYLGAPVWSLKDWVGNFFPPKTKPADFLSHYSRRLNTVEGNTVFYATPSVATVARWRAETPPGFKFCLKFPQAISHQRRLRSAEAETKAFLACLETLADRCGPSFLQLPPNFSGRDLPVLAAYLASLPRAFSYAVEPRHADFFSPPHEAALDDLLRRHAVARVCFDTRAIRQIAQPDAATRQAQERKPNFPPRMTRTASFALIRYVGPPVPEANHTWLAEWAQPVAQWLAAQDDVFFFTHCPDDTFAPDLARYLHSLINAHHAVPPLPAWGETPAVLTQHSLF